MREIANEKYEEPLSGSFRNIAAFWAASYVITRQLRGCSDNLAWTVNFMKGRTAHIRPSFFSPFVIYDTTPDRATNKNPAVCFTTALTRGIRLHHTGCSKLFSVMIRSPIARVAEYKCRQQAAHAYFDLGFFISRKKKKKETFEGLPDKTLWDGCLTKTRRSLVTYHSWDSLQIRSTHRGAVITGKAM